MHCKNVWVWKMAACDAAYGLHVESVLHEPQKRSTISYAECWAFLMQYGHQKAVKTRSVMLRHAPQTSWVMQNVHDKRRALPDPDIFAFDILVVTVTKPCFVWRTAAVLPDRNPA